MIQRKGLYGSGRGGVLPLPEPHSPVSHFAISMIFMLMYAKLILRVDIVFYMCYNETV